MVFPSAPIRKTTGRLFRRGHCWPPGATGSEARRCHDWREASFSQRILLGGRAGLAAGDFGEQHPQGQARSFMAAPTRIFSRSSTDRDAKYQSMMRSLDSEMPGGAGSELNQGLTPRSQSDVQRDVSREPFRRCALVEHAFHNPVSDNKKRWNQKEIRHGERKDIG